MAENEKDKKAKQQTDNEKAGSLAGVGAGALAGAQAGTVLLPIPVVGTFTGALVGGVLGSKIGKKYGGAMLDKLSSNKTEASSEKKKDVAAELAKLAELHKQGVLDDAEFKAAKASLLNI